MKAQHYDEAVAKVGHALQIEPDDAQLLNLLGEIEKRRGNYSTADSLYRGALAKFETSNETSHLAITRTAMADNLRKWAEVLMTTDTEMATSYLNQGYQIMTEAASTDSSPRAQATLREIAFALARLRERQEHVAEAIRYYSESISWGPIRESDKRKATTAALYIADQLLRAERRGDSRKYLDLAHRYSRGWEVKQLDGLEMDYERGRAHAILYRVINGKGYGFLGNDTRSAVFLHYSNVVPPVGISEFERLEGEEFSFVVTERDGKLAAVRACPRSSVLADDALIKGLSLVTADTRSRP
jgi:tetratricopeptide (TPR) repeat protein/cold shock CspA family protein